MRSISVLLTVLLIAASNTCDAFAPAVTIENDSCRSRNYYFDSAVVDDNNNNNNRDSPFCFTYRYVASDGIDCCRHSSTAVQVLLEWNSFVKELQSFAISFLYGPVLRLVLRYSILHSLLESIQSTLLHSLECSCCAWEFRWNHPTLNAWLNVLVPSPLPLLAVMSSCRHLLSCLAKYCSYHHRFQQD